MSGRIPTLAKFQVKVLVVFNKKKFLFCFLCQELHVCLRAEQVQQVIVFFPDFPFSFYLAPPLRCTVSYGADSLSIGLSRLSPTLIWRYSLYLSTGKIKWWNGKKCRSGIFYCFSDHYFFLSAMRKCIGENILIFKERR